MVILPPFRIPMMHKQPIVESTILNATPRPFPTVWETVQKGRNAFGDRVYIQRLGDGIAFRILDTKRIDNGTAMRVVAEVSGQMTSECVRVLSDMGYMPDDDPIRVAIGSPKA